MKNILLTLLLFSTEIIYGQIIKTDTSVSMEHSRTYYVPRVGLSYQKSTLFELGICRQWSYRGDEYSKTKSYGTNSAAYFGTYLSAETIVKNENSIYGIKIGAETVLIGGASLGILLGLEATDYFYQSRHYLAVTPKLIIPLTPEATPLAFFSYGYSINDFNAFSSTIGDHRLSLILNLCIKEHLQINKMHKDFRNAVNKMKSGES